MEEQLAKIEQEHGEVKMYLSPSILDLTGPLVTNDFFTLTGADGREYKFILDDVQAMSGLIEVRGTLWTKE